MEDEVVLIFKNRKVYWIGKTPVVSIPVEVMNTWKEKYGENLKVNLKLLTNGTIIVEPVSE